MGTSSQPVTPPPLPPRDPPPLPPRDHAPATGRRPLPKPDYLRHPAGEFANKAMPWKQAEYLATVPDDVRKGATGLCWALVHKWILYGGSFRSFQASLAELAVKKELLAYHDSQYGLLLDDELLRKRNVTPLAAAWTGSIQRHGATPWIRYLTSTPSLCCISLGSRQAGVAGHSIGTRFTGTTARFFDPNSGEFTYDLPAGQRWFEIALLRLMFDPNYGDLLSNVTIRKYALPQKVRD
jgi:hypothetical protein